MMPAYVAASELDRRRAERSAEIARQLPLYAEEVAYFEPPVDGAQETRQDPDWMSNY